MVIEAFDGYIVAGRATSFSFEPSGFEGRMLRGKSREFKSVLRAARPVTFDLGPVGWLRAPVASFSPGSWPFEFTLASELSGTYATDSLPADASSRYGLFVSRVKVPFSVNLRVYPRLIAAALAALEYLTRVGAGTEGEVEKNVLGPASSTPSRGNTCPETTSAGLTGRRPARSSSLMIKHFYSEGGGRFTSSTSSRPRGTSPTTSSPPSSSTWWCPPPSA